MSLRKTATIDAPHATFKGWGAFGESEYRILKTYKKPESEAKDPYARWMVAVKTEATFGSFDIGDTYISDVIRDTRRMEMTQATDEWVENYPASKHWASA